MLKALKISILGAALAVGLSASAEAATYDFTFTGTTNYAVTGKFTTDASNDIIAASGVVTSLGASFTQGAFTFTGPGAGSGGSQDWSNVYDPGIPGFSGNGLGLDIAGTFASLYNGISAGYAPCPGTCLSVDPSSQGALWNPGDVGTLSVVAVPEPAIWATMLFGVGMIGAGLRMARRKNEMALTAA